MFTVFGAVSYRGRKQIQAALFIKPKRNKKSQTADRDISQSEIRLFLSASSRTAWRPLRLDLVCVQVVQRQRCRGRESSPAADALSSRQGCYLMSNLWSWQKALTFLPDGLSSASLQLEQSDDGRTETRKALRGAVRQQSDKWLMETIKHVQQQFRAKCWTETLVAPSCSNMRGLFCFEVFKEQKVKKRVSDF